MFSFLYKSNIIKSQNKTILVFIISSITYIILHYIIFNDALENIEIINFVKSGFYIAFLFDFVFFIKSLTEDELKKEIEKAQNEKKEIEEYYGSLINQLTTNIQEMNNQNQQDIQQNNNSQNENQKENIKEEIIKQTDKFINEDVKEDVKTLEKENQNADDLNNAESVNAESVKEE